MSTFLQLAPEQGGTQFGPFEAGLIALGADAGRCQIVLGTVPGIAPVHVQISDHGNGTYTVSPVDRNAPVYLLKPGATQLRAISHAMSVRAGETIVLGGEAGPRFTLQHQNAAQAAKAAGPKPHMSAAQHRIQQQGGFANAMGNEVKREAFAKLVGKNVYFSQLYEYYYKYHSGSFFQPRNIIGLITLVGGALFLGGGLSCTGLFAYLFHGGHLHGHH